MTVYDLIGLLRDMPANADVIVTVTRPQHRAHDIADVVNGVNDHEIMIVTTD